MKPEAINGAAQADTDKNKGTKNQEKDDYDDDVADNYEDNNF